MEKDLEGVDVDNYPEFSGKVAVVTGAARGMGAAFAEGLARRGVHVIAGDIDLAGMEATATRISDAVGDGTRVIGRHLDVTVADDHSALAAEAIDTFGRLDFWVNNAGLFPQAGVLDITPQQFRSTFGVNVDGVLFGAQAAARVMKTGGSIVNLASVAAFRVRPTRATYSVTKAAVDHLTKFLAVELGERGLRVNAIAPGFIETDMTLWVREDPEAAKSVLAGIPLGRFGTPTEVLDVLLFLLSDAASYVSGSTLCVDGASRHL